MIKAIFFDLDGTLLNSEKIIPVSAFEAIKRCRKKGIKIFLATARVPSLTRALGWEDETISLFDGGVYCNGAINIFKNEKNYNFINGEVINSIVKVMRKYTHINIALQSTDNIHAFGDPLSEKELSVWGLGSDNIISINDINRREILKAMRFDGEFSSELRVIPDEVINIISNECGKLARVYVTDHKKVIQIVSLSASKYMGIEYLKKKTGFGKNEIAVFGDDMNDMEMISCCEFSVAMGSACEEIKKAASFTTKTNDEDGISFAIENYLRI